ncbi:hypothetical protein KAR91_42700 [Candidatus Pacearchaeota archaeon]|nr:hypothetical protein [Candidatus Pacearchaeota archaeon]
MSIEVKQGYIAVVSNKEYKVILGLFELSNSVRLNQPFIQFWTNHTKNACKDFLHNSELFDYLREYGDLFETQAEVNEILTDLLKQVNKFAVKSPVKYMNKEYVSGLAM